MESPFGPFTNSTAIIKHLQDLLNPLEGPRELEPKFVTKETEQRPVRIARHNRVLDKTLACNEGLGFCEIARKNGLEEREDDEASHVCSADSMLSYTMVLSMGRSIPEFPADNKTCRCSHSLY